MLCRARRVSGNLSTLCKPTSKVLEFPFKPLHFTYTRVAIRVGKPSPFLTGTRSDHTYVWEGQPSYNPTSLKKTVEYLGSTSEWQIWQKNFAAALRACALCRLDLEYFSQIWSTWIDYVNLTVSWRYSRRMCKQSTPGHFFSSAAWERGSPCSP